MDRTGKIVVSLSFVLLVAWFIIAPRYLAPKSSPTAAPATSNAPAAAATSASPTSVPGAVAIAPAPAAAAKPASPEKTEILENDKVRITVTSHGGGIRQIELKEHPESIACGPYKRFAGTNLAALNYRAPVAAYALGGGLDGDGDYSLFRNGSTLRAEKLVPNGVKVVKEFTLLTNHQFAVHARIENASRQPLALPPQEWNIGTAIPMNAHDDATMMGFYWFDGDKARQVAGWVPTPGFLCIPTKPQENSTAGASNVFWASVHNQFFTMISVPDAPATNVVARRVPLPPPPAEQLAVDTQAKANPVGAETALLFPAVTLKPGEAIDRKFQVYAGPKKYLALSRMENRIDLVMDYTGFSGPFAKLLLVMMNFLHESLSLSYGLCIIALTIIVRGVFWPFSMANFRMSKKMAALGPQLKAIQEKYKDDPRKMQAKSWELQRQHGVNPITGCLPVLFQLPIFFGLFTMLRTAIELRGSSFLWMCDLSAPDTLFEIPGLRMPFNLMPILYLGTAFMQSHMTPPSPQMDPMQQKMIKYMPLAFLFIFYNYAAGLALYWTVSNLITILQMYLNKREPAPVLTEAAGAAAKPHGKSHR